MARELNLVAWVLAGALLGFFLVGTGGALVGLLVFGALAAAWLAVRPAVDRRPTRGVYGVAPTLVAVPVGIGALFLWPDNRLAGWVVLGLGVVAAPLLGRRARSWPQAVVLGGGMLVLAVVVAFFVFFVDVATHGGFD
jgi:hypothetical protein